MNRWPISNVQSLVSRHRRLVRWGGGAAILVISGLLLSQSFAASFNRYQAYRDGIATLRALESEFNQEILRSRYELFASYDGLVTNLAAQEALHTQLSDIPGFVGSQERQVLRRVLQERQTGLTQKEDLSEWFKSRNALLKNSLRYLPLLTRQIEASFDAAALSIPASDEDTDALSTGTSDQATPSLAGEEAENSGDNAIEATIPENLPAGSPPDADPALGNQLPQENSTIATIALDAGQRETLRGTLNQLIRNLLLYNASDEAQVADQAEALTQELAALENTLEIPQEALPTQVFRSHANVILTTKPLVEELTGQLLLPLAQHTEELEVTLEQAYRQSSRRTSLFRALSLVWFLGLFMVGTHWYIKRSRGSDPAFERYQQQVGTLATTATQLQSAAAWTDEKNLTASLAPLLQRDDDLGHLARHLQHLGQQQQQAQQVTQEEAFAFLTARLNLLTKNRRKVINTEAAIALRSTVEAQLAEQDCILLDLQLETDQVSVLFRYPLSLSLANLIHQLKQATAAALHAVAITIDPPLSNPDEIWSDAYLIASCPPPEPATSGSRLVSQGESR